LEPRVAKTQVLIQILTCPCSYKNFSGHYPPKYDAGISSRTLEDPQKLHPKKTGLMKKNRDGTDHQEPTGLCNQDSRKIRNNPPKNMTPAEAESSWA